MNFLVEVLLAFSLSMDAFSLALIYGMVGFKRSKQYILSLVVGVYHFVMPIIGIKLGKIIIEVLPIPFNWLIFVIFVFIGISMIRDAFLLDKQASDINFIEILVFGFAVSVDSLMTGIGMINVVNNEFKVALIFAIFSGFMTLLGLKLGGHINKIIGNISSILGGICLIIMGMIYLLVD